MSLAPTYPIYSIVFAFYALLFAHILALYEHVAHRLCKCLLFMKMCLTNYAHFCFLCGCASQIMHIFTFNEDMPCFLCTFSLFMNMWLTNRAYTLFSSRCASEIKKYLGATVKPFSLQPAAQFLNLRSHSKPLLLAIYDCRKLSYLGFFSRWTVET